MGTIRTFRNFTFWLLLTVIIFLKNSRALPSATRHLLPIVVNRIIGTNSSCDSKSMNVTVHLQFPFKGALFAKDFSQECKTLGGFTNHAGVNLPTSGCGVRLASKEDENGAIKMFYTVTIVAQQDRYLRQVSDQERVIDCFIEDSAFAVKSRSMKDAVEKEILGYNKKGLGRTARMQEGWSKDFDESDETDKTSEELEGMLAAARAWMEITPAKNGASNLQVGEPALLTVKCTLPSGIGWKVIDCTAHDGLGESSQKLLDEQGCPVDEVLLPLPKFGSIKQMNLMRHQEAVAEFSAFKFPDRDRLHVSCGLQLCRGFCENINCDGANSTNDNRLGRTLTRGEKGEILDRLEIFNSVQVRAPAIDLDQTKSTEKGRDLGSLSPFGHLPGDRAFCVSPDKMAITFCILGLIFLFAVIVATLALLRARRSGDNLMPYYTRSLFSSYSSSTTASGGSKLLLHESPYLGQSTSRGLHYGRIL